MLLALILSPVFAACASLFARWIGTQGVFLISTSSIGVGLLYATVSIYEVWWCSSALSLSLGDWFIVDSQRVQWTLVLDSTAAGMVQTVMTVSCGVHFYSGWYLEGEPHLSRYMLYIGAFTALMLVLSMSTGLALAFVGWEGIGIVSYLLISLWYTRANAVQSGMQAFLLNRIGDTALTLVLAMAFAGAGSLSWSVLGEASSSLSESTLVPLGFLVACAAAGKSAQLGLQAWLPNAMEAPTPVSALIHAATLVTAGALLLIRCSPLLEASSGSTIAFVALLGACTAVYAGVTALRQTDLKRVIAFSTCSQVAYIVLACGTGQYTASFSLLILHALYKAVLFLGAGAVIHALAGLQDLRLMGGLSRFLPFTATIMLLAMAALGAAPYTSGDFSKDIIIETQLGGFMVLHNVTWILALLSAALTLYYSGRLHFLAFEGLPRATPTLVSGLHDPTTPTVRVILTLLGVLSIVAGYCLSEVFAPNAGVLGLSELPSTTSPLDTEYSASALLMTLPLVASALGLFVGTTEISVPVDLKRSRHLSYLSNIVSQTKWGTDSFLAQGIARSGLSAAYVSYKTLDRGVFELLGPFGVSTTLLALAHSRLDVSGREISRLVLLTSGAALGFGIAASFGASIPLVVLYVASMALFL